MAADLHLDNDVALGYQALLRAHGHDVTTAAEAGLESAGDEQQLLSAAQARRILVTHNRKDFRLLHRAWNRWAAAWGVTAEHAGILIIPQVKPAQRPAMAQELSAFVSSGRALVNELYEWRPGAGWSRSS